MRTRLLASLASSLGVDLRVEPCFAQGPSGTNTFDPVTTNTDAAINAATEAHRFARVKSRQAADNPCERRQTRIVEG